VKRRHGEEGVAVVLSLALVAVLAVAAITAGGIGVTIAAHRRAQAAADLGALAGAGAAQTGDDACAAARRVVARNGADLATCAVSGAVIQVEVRVALPGLLGDGEVRARSRAGPAVA
jgi:secretion/DNA translocation related TadE-like protein